jgi:uncharacterized membrane protein YfcA
VRVVAIAVCALLASGLTFFSGFGLGTLLLPAMAAFLPVEVAVAATAIVHFVNNALKLGLLRRHVDRGIATRFGLPAILAAFGGAALLGVLGSLEPIGSYSIGAHRFVIEPVALVVAALIAVFGVGELRRPRTDARGIDPRWLPVGGAATGFVGGLSGLQGALRSAFLIRTGLPKEGYLATGGVIAVVVDMARLAVYGAQGSLEAIGAGNSLVIAGIAGAAVGTFAGNRLLRKVTIRQVQLVVGLMLLGVAVALGAGLL